MNNVAINNKYPLIEQVRNLKNKLEKFFHKIELKFRFHAAFDADNGIDSSNKGNDTIITHLKKSSM